MPVIEIQPDVYWVGVNDRTTDLFESLWPIAREGVWRKEPQRIIGLYKKWAEYATGKTENGITLLYGSMYGNTEAMVNAVAQGISRTCVPLEIFDGARTHASYVLPYLWTRLGVVIGAPTYDTRLFTPVAHILDMAVRKGIKNKKVLRFGSYGWVGGAQKEFEKIMEAAQWDLVDSFEFNGQPTKEDLKKGEELGRTFAEMIETA